MPVSLREPLLLSPITVEMVTTDEPEKTTPEEPGSVEVWEGHNSSRGRDNPTGSTSM